MDLDPARHEANGVHLEPVSELEQNLLLRVNKSYSNRPSFSIKKSHYCISLSLAFLLGMICTAAFIAAQEKPAHRYHALQPVSEGAARTSLQSAFISDLLIGYFESARELMSLHGRNVKSQLKRFLGTYNASSLYKGPPSPEVDRMWQKYWDIWTFGIGETDFESLNAPNKGAAAYVADESDGTDGKKLYMGTFEAVHQLHCLYNLFRASYRDYYEEERLDFAANPAEYHSRLDHCVDILRQKLECDGDSSVVTYNWVKHRRRPVANFNVEHRCRSWDDLREFTQQHEISGVPQKPADVTELEQIP